MGRKTRRWRTSASLIPGSGRVRVRFHRRCRGRERFPDPARRSWLRSFGVEEELLLVAPSSGIPVALGESVTRGGGEDAPEHELQRQQVETDTDPCTTLGE